MLKTQPKWVWLLAMIAWLLTPVATAAALPAPTHDKRGARPDDCAGDGQSADQSLGALSPPRGDIPPIHGTASRRPRGGALSAIEHEGVRPLPVLRREAPVEKSADGRIPIRFEDRHTPESQTARTTIKAVSATGAESKPYTVSIMFAPKEMYAANGQTVPGYIIMNNTDLVMATSCVDDWILQRPTPMDVDFAKKMWGHLLSDARSEHENACGWPRRSWMIWKHTGECHRMRWASCHRSTSIGA